jgi:hypothetical protein
MSYEGDPPTKAKLFWPRPRANFRLILDELGIETHGHTAGRVERPLRAESK